MHPQTLFWMLDRHMQPRSPVPPDADAHSRFVEFRVEAEPVCGFLEVLAFEQLRTGCGGPAEFGSLLIAADPAILWSHVQGHLAKIRHCRRGGGLKVQIGYEPSRTFFDMRRHALYEMAGHLTEVG